MCFIEKMNCIWIHKKEDRTPDPVLTLGQVWYESASSSQKQGHGLKKGEKEKGMKNEKKRKTRKMRWMSLC